MHIQNVLLSCYKNVEKINNALPVIKFRVFLEGFIRCYEKYRWSLNFQISILKIGIAIFKSLVYIVLRRGLIKSSATLIHKSTTDLSSSLKLSRIMRYVFSTSAFSNWRKSKAGYLAWTCCTTLTVASACASAKWKEDTEKEDSLKVENHVLKH